MKIVLYTEGLRFTGDGLEQQALGGSESAFIAVARELARLGHQVTALCPCTREGCFDGVEYRDLATLDRWEREEHDLFLCSRYFFVLARPLRARVKLLWLHDVLSPELARLLAPLLPRLSAVYCLSQYHRTLSLTALPALAGVLRVTHNGIDPALVDEACAGASSKRHRLMFTSRPERGLAAALDIYEQLEDRALELLVCSYPSPADPRIAAVEAEVQRRLTQLARRGFRVSSGAFAKRALYRHIAESKLVLYPTDFAETFCISALEAQACGTVFLTSDDFALRETVGYGRVARGDRTQFVRRAAALLTDDALRAALEGAGRTHALGYTWAAVARRFVDDTRELGGLDLPQPALALFDRIGLPPSRSMVPDATVDAPEPAPPSIAARAQWLWARREAALSRRHLVGGTQPRISCVTAASNRLLLLKRAIASYCDQTWASRELVIVSQSGARYRQAVADHVAALGRDDIRLLFVDGTDDTPGSLRNLSIDAARGDLLCRWDDDDCSYPDRLATQAAHLLASGRHASFMTDHLHLSERERALRWIDRARGGTVTGTRRLASGTLMMFRDRRFRYPEPGSSAHQGEDCELLAALCAAGPVAELSEAGHLQLSTDNGRDRSPREDYRDLEPSSRPATYLHQRRALVRRVLDYYPVPRPVAVTGLDAVAYSDGDL